MGVKKPKIETPKSLMAFMKENNFETDSTFVLQKEEYFYTVTRDLIFPNLLIFDKNGYLVNNNTSCSPDENYPVDLLIQQGARDSTRTLEFYFSKMSRMNGAAITPDNSKDIKAIIIWMIATGKMGIKKVKTFEKLVGSSDTEIITYYLNIDMQNFWYSTETPPPH